MSSSILKLTVDRQNKTLVSFSGSVGSIPDCFQSNILSLQIQIVDPTGSFNPAYSIVDMNGFGLRASVGGAPTGTSGGPTPLALQDTFAWDSTNKWFTADLALNTTAIDNFIGALQLATAYFELNLTASGNRLTILQKPFALRAVVDELTSTAPSPTDQYLTRAEIISQFMPLKGANGQTFILVSPNGSISAELGIDNNGNLTTKILS